MRIALAASTLAVLGLAAAPAVADTPKQGYYIDPANGVYVIVTKDRSKVKSFQASCMVKGTDGKLVQNSSIYTAKSKRIAIKKGAFSYTGTVLFPDAYSSTPKRVQAKITGCVQERQGQGHLRDHDRRLQLREGLVLRQVLRRQPAGLTPQRRQRDQAPRRSSSASSCSRTAAGSSSPNGRGAPGPAGARPCSASSSTVQQLLAARRRRCRGPSVSRSPGGGHEADRRLDGRRPRRRSGGRPTRARGCSRRSPATGTCRRRPCGTS